MSRLGAIGSSLVLACAVASCATVRNARLAQDPSSAVPGERTPTAAELGLATEGALRLDDALNAALRVHPSILGALHNEEAAAARTGQAEGALWPSLSSNASYEYTDHKTQSGAPAIQHHFQSLGFQLSWLLFDFGRTPALAREAADQWLAAQADTRGVEIDVAFAVRSAYFTLLKQMHLRAVAEDTVAQFQEHLDQVHEFVIVGTRIPYDETKAEVDLGNAQLLLVQTEDAVLTAQATLANAIGLAETTDWAPEETETLPDEPPPFEECWKQARLTRPALAAAAARVEAASELVNARIASLYPSLGLGFGANWAGTSFPLPWSLQFGPSLSWIPFDGFTNLYTIDEAAASLRGSRAALAAIEQQAWLDVRTAWLAMQDARRRLDVTTLNVRNAEENVTLAQGRFDVGKGTTVELTDARQALVKARADDVQARADLDVAAARLQRELGIGFEPAPRAADDSEGKP
jgi:outer membrane protein TolC